MAIAFSAPTPAVQPSPTDASARIYVRALISGEKPAERPATFGRWDACIKSLENAFKISKGDGQAVANMLENLVKSKRYPGLKDLMAEQQDEEEEEGPYIPVLPEWCRAPKGPRTGHLSWASASACFEEFLPYFSLKSPESHAEYGPACFISLLSGIAAHRLMIPFEEPDYTPLLILMCSDPSVYKKTTAAKVVRNLLRDLGLKFLDESASQRTPQKLIYNMAGTVPKDFSGLTIEKQEYHRKKLAFAGQRWLYSDEFGQQMKNIANPNSVMSGYQSLFLEMDSCNPEFVSDNLTRSNEVVENPYLSFLGAMTPGNIAALGKKGDEFFGSGFWSRFAFATAPRLKKGESPPDSPFRLGKTPPPAQLLLKLRAWHDRLGEPDCFINPEIKDDKETGKVDVVKTALPEHEITVKPDVYDAWTRYRSGLKQIFAHWHLTDLNASYDRLATRAMRVAALIASLENNNVIELQHWYLAQEIAERWRVSLHELYHQVNSPRGDEKSKEAKAEDRIIEVVRRLEEKGNPPSAKEIKDYCKNLDRALIERKCKELVQIGVLEVLKTSRTNRYKYIGDEDDE